MKKTLSFILVFAMVAGLAAFSPFAAPGSIEPLADEPVYAPVRRIDAPVAGHYPISFYRNTVRDTTSRANSGMTQTVSWYPDIDDRGFLTNTAYTAVLELEPAAQATWTSAGFPGAPSFSANSITWENLGNLPPLETIASIKYEYFSGTGSGNYYDGFSGPADPAGANLRIFMEFLPTAAVKSDPDVIFFDDFNGQQRTGAAAVNGTTTSFIRGTEQKRQDAGAYWTNSYSNLRPDPSNPGNTVLELGWEIADYDFASRQVTSNSFVGMAPTRPATPPAAFGLKNDAGNDVLEILLGVAIYDANWMGSDYITTSLATTAAAWDALEMAEKLAAWNALAAEAKLEIWDAFWPVEWTDGREYGRRNFVRAGCWDTRGGSGVDAFQNAYGYYEVNMKMTPANGVWTAFWMNNESTGGGGTDNTINDVSRVDSANPVVARQSTDAQKLTILRRQACWSGAEIDVIENCEPVLERGYSSSFHYGGYGSYGAGTAHQESWMPGTPDEIDGINLYDGEFHRIGIEWSPTDAKFYIDDVVHCSAADISTHWPEFVQDKDQVLRVPFLDGRLAIPQNPNMMRLSVEADYWSGHGTEYEYYPYDCGVGIREDRSLPRLTSGTLENGAAAVVDYVIVYNGPKPAAPTAVGVTADERVSFGDSVEYTFAARNMETVNLVELTFEADGGILGVADGIFEGLNGFSVFKGPEWADLGNGKWQAKAIIGIVENGQTRSGDMDIAKLAFDAARLGDAKLELVSAVVYGIDVVDGAVGSHARRSTISPATATAKVFSIYDINGDDEVGLADLSLAFYYYRSAAGDEGWEQAKAADVNGDGVVDMLDLVEIYANFIAH